ncbi:YdiU family protein [Ornithinibacillus sp. L9]|uniref:Protein nucleotidyltransferase YdiU n=1 Tax=Ornithinibacillus caprae TaxID=2678566 RepID=A0A6N8FIE6_9BACI|nr:YdiU family protein [Ornithinibacillus caprae]MUK88034.1 YdiU family protein [Ornithinibacillus caprae]
MTNKKNIGWNFDNTYSQLPEAYFTKQNPTPVRSPQLRIFNEPLAKSLGLEAQTLQSQEGIEVFSGNNIPDGGFPLAQAYAGHQFGHFTMLGDGRAVLIGEQNTPTGERFDIQLKGAGATPYSRGGDGRATLGPMLREYIISEAMHALGIPTTRSLAVVTTGEEVMRETALPGAILTRVAASHLRVGTFEYSIRWGTDEEHQQLADYAIKRHYPAVEADENKYLSLLREVSKRQAALIAKWQLVGFIHGVMNTDNMTISGETIDYGPCAFMDEYDPETVFSSIDRQGRYAYGNQPGIGRWNLTRFAETLVPFMHEDQDQAVELAKNVLSEYADLYQQYWLDGMRAKLGLVNEERQDESLIKVLLQVMKKYNADYTNTFRALTIDQLEGMTLFASQEFKQWHEQWKDRLSRQQESKEQVQELMRKNNPSVIPRNHRVEEALEAAVEHGDYSVLKKLLDVLSKPYAYSPDQKEYCKLPAPSDRPYQTFCGT